ncbi:hypothetical protein D3C85_1650840 [compost metagenome]
MSDMFDRVQEALTPEEIAQFVQLMIKVGKALQQPPTGRPAGAEQKPRSIQIED